jgi:hypothetical protein
MSERNLQMELIKTTTSITRSKANTTEAGTEDNKLRPEDRAAHDWYRFVLSFPPHLVRKYLERFRMSSGNRVLDPFCGTGTTLVECKKHGIACVGLEANPMPCFASQVKVTWNIDPDALVRHACGIAGAASKRLDEEGFVSEEPTLFSKKRAKVPVRLRKLQTDLEKLILKDSISPLPLHKTLVLIDTMKEFENTHFSDLEQLALAKAVVFGISNLHFGPEVGVGRPRKDAPVIETWLTNVHEMAADLRALNSGSEAIVHRSDSRHIASVLEPGSIDAVITSPPYPNEKDYTRTTRLESVLLGFIKSKEDLRAVKRGLIRSNTRGVYKGDSDDLLVSGNGEIERIASAIEARRIELGKTSGFERLYARVTKLYFGGMAKHLTDLRTILRPGAYLAYVVGDQASYLRVMIRTGQLLADIAASLGYEIVDIDLFRTRLATATREQLREEVVVMRWHGTGH